jgi:hypothetical protein
MVILFVGYIRVLIDLITVCGFHKKRKQFRQTVYPPER